MSRVGSVHEDYRKSLCCKYVFNTYNNDIIKYKRILYNFRR